MLETISKKILNENTFLFQFVDKSISELRQDQSDEIRNYETLDSSEYKMGLRINAIPKAVLIDIKIIYPPNFYHPNIYELLDLNEKMFHGFYNERMHYSKPVDYTEIVSSKEPYTTRSK
jgi:hypothetical protein